jgi:hypothetical protein
MSIATHQCTHPRRVEPSSMMLGELQILQEFYFLYKIKHPENTTAG